MQDEARYTLVYGVLIAGLMVELLMAIYHASLGNLATAGILAIAGLQALFIFVAFMHARYGPRAVVAFALVSVLTVLPLLIAFLLSVSSPQHRPFP